MANEQKHGIFAAVLESLAVLFILVCAAALAVSASWGAVLFIEARTEKQVTSRLLEGGIMWASASTDGLRVAITGTAPDEAARFSAISQAGTVVDASRIDDLLDVTPLKQIDAPEFSIEMLRNDDGIQLIGLLPDNGHAAQLLAQARDLADGRGLLDMLETAAYPPSEAWQASFDYGVEALRLLPRSQISITNDAVKITAIADSAAEKKRFEQGLKARQPDGVNVSLNISAPRPVLTPFTLRFVVDETGARFDACSADSEAAKAAIVKAAITAGIPPEEASCTIGLGVPSPSWAAAAVMGIEAVTKLGSATVTFSDADVTLIATNRVAQRDFERVVGVLQNALPDVFSLTSRLEPPEEATADLPEFSAALSSDGALELRGRLMSEGQRLAIESFAKSRFGAKNVYVGTLINENIGTAWAVRILAGLEALTTLESGQFLVQADQLTIEGVTGNQNAKNRISQILAERLNVGQSFTVNVTYDENLDVEKRNSPEKCFARLINALGDGKITFAPSSTEVDDQGIDIINKIAEGLDECPGLPVEISGYTDNRGRDEGNMTLSQKRAEAVLLALKLRGIDASAMIARGYGENNPIADNSTEEGREANRRIAFTLLSEAAEESAAGETIVDEGEALKEGAPQEDVSEGGAPKVDAAEGALLNEGGAEEIVAQDGSEAVVGSRAPPKKQIPSPETVSKP